MRGFNIFAPPPQASQTVEVWEENWPAVMFFSRLGTQWRMSGMGSPSGLDYTAVLALLRTLRLPRDEAEAMFADVQAMEGAALEAMADARAKK